ncbi:MAG: hypothetical protein ACJ74Z_21735 [Bryobacteraceae bacterium]
MLLQLGIGGYADRFRTRGSGRARARNRGLFYGVDRGKVTIRDNGESYGPGRPDKLRIPAAALWI